jgi:hypothetical protein
MYGAVCPFCRLAHGGTKSSPPHLAGTTMHKLAIAAVLASSLRSLPPCCSVNAKARLHRDHRVRRG